MAATATRRRPACDPRPSPETPVARASPEIVWVSTVVERSGTASERAVAFWRPMLIASTTISTSWSPRPHGHADDRDEHRTEGEQRDLGDRRDGEVPSAARAEHRGRADRPASPPTAKAASASSDERRGEPGRPDEREPQEQHVARHVRDEDVAEHEVAEGVDEPGDDGQGHEERRRAVRARRRGRGGASRAGRRGRRSWLSFGAARRRGRGGAERPAT